MPKLPLEHEIETVFVHHVRHELNRFTVIGRQVRLPSGILDLLLLHRSAVQITPIVVEVKRDIIDAEACAQVIGYMGQINQVAGLMLANRAGWYSVLHETAAHNRNLQGWLIGRRITKKAARIVASHNLAFIRYSIGDHGLIEFSRYTDSFTKISLPLEDYNPPTALEVVAAAMEFNARHILAHEETWGSSYPEDNPAITGKDHHPELDASQSVPRWDWEVWRADRETE